MTADAVGGVWTYARELAAALDADVQMATMGPPPSGVEPGVHVSTFALEWEDDPWEDVGRAGRWLLELEEELRPDVVHVNGYAHAALPWRAPVVVVAHSDVVSWWWAVHGEAPPARWERYRRSVEAGLGAADVVVAPTRAVMHDLERHYDLAGERVVIPNGRNASIPPAAKEPFVLASGRFWDAAKNIAALEAVRDDVPWPIVLVGDGTPGGRVGTHEHARLLARAGVFCSPALYEPFGLGILEAAQAGCALVLGDIPSLREIWAGAALFVPPRDREALAAALQGACSDAELRGDLAARAARRSARYRADTMATAYAALYERVLDTVPA